MRIALTAKALRDLVVDAMAGADLFYIAASLTNPKYNTASEFVASLDRVIATTGPDTPLVSNEEGKLYGFDITFGLIGHFDYATGKVVRNNGNN